MWSPHSPDTIATACGDGHLRVFDLRASNPAVAGPAPVLTVPVGGEVLTCDWNKYRPMTVATGSTDKSIKVWDLRAAGGAAGAGAGQAGGASQQQHGQITAVCTGHDYAVRRVAFSVSPRMHTVIPPPRGTHSTTHASLAATLGISLGISIVRHVGTDMGRRPSCSLPGLCSFEVGPTARWGRRNSQGSRCTHRVCSRFRLELVPRRARGDDGMGHVSSSLAGLIIHTMSHFQLSANKLIQLQKSIQHESSGASRRCGV